MTRKRLAIIVSVALVVAVGAMVLAPTASPSRLLAPAIFIPMMMTATSPASSSR